MCVCVHSCLGSQVGRGTLASLKVPRPSFKATDYSEYGELPLDKAFQILPEDTVGVCVVTNSSEGIVVREGQALRSRGAAVKCLKEYAVPGPQSSYLSIYPCTPISAQVEGNRYRCIHMHIAGM